MHETNSHHRGAGFVGSHSCEYLLEQGNEAICLDNYFTGKTENYPSFDNPYFGACMRDITMPYYIEVDKRFINLACPASPVHYQFNPIKTIKTSVLNTHALAC